MKNSRTEYNGDIDAILSRRRDNGADIWASPDGNLLKGSPFSTLEAAYILAELGCAPDEPTLAAAAALIWNTQRENGRFAPVPKSASFPCQTIHAAKTLSYLGFAADCRLETTYAHLLETQYADGGWRCNKFFYGRGPETEASNPGPTLAALDAFRFTPFAAFLLAHWDTRAPLGPCHYGIGTLFHQVAFPFLTYNLFYYVFVLSFYQSARRDPRFLDALCVLQGKLRDGRIVVERTHQKLAGFDFCKKGEPSGLATERYRALIDRLN
jgi:hypothetical protein